MKKRLSSAFIATILTGCAALAGCATMPAPSYVSPNTYQNYDCNGLSSEYRRLSQLITANTNQQSGVTLSGVGIGVGIGRGGLYPSVTVGVGQATVNNRGNLALALGERDAVVQAGRLKQCGFVSGLKLSSEK